MQGKFRDTPLPPTGFYTWVDVRDVALAHLRAIDRDAAGGNRIALVGGYFSNKSLMDTIGKTHPELRENLSTTSVDDMEANQFFYSGTKAAELLGLHYRSFEACIGDAVTSLQGFGA